MKPGRRRHLALALLLTGTTFAACGSSDDGGAAGPSADEAGGEVRECEPVGTALAERATATVPVLLDEYAFSPSSAEVKAGVVTFTVDNVGEEEHELAFLPGGGDVPLTDAGEPDEEALVDAGAFELEAFGPERSCAATYELEAGTYTLFCIVQAADGETHLEKGMRGLLTVS